MADHKKPNAESKVYYKNAMKVNEQIFCSLTRLTKEKHKVEADNGNDRRS